MDFKTIQHQRPHFSCIKFPTWNKKRRKKRRKRRKKTKKKRRKRRKKKKEKNSFYGSSKAKYRSNVRMYGENDEKNDIYVLFWGFFPSHSEKSVEKLFFRKISNEKKRLDFFFKLFVNFWKISRNGNKFWHAPDSWIWDVLRFWLLIFIQLKKLKCQKRAALTLYLVRFAIRTTPRSRFHSYTRLDMIILT